MRDTVAMFWSWFCLSGLTIVFIHDSYYNKCSYKCKSQPLHVCIRIALPLLNPAPFIHSLYLCLIANAGSIATAIDLSAETPSRQEK